MANLTWVAGGRPPVAFDTGPGNALLDQWVERHTGRLYDDGGALAACGRISEAAVSRYLAAPWFDRKPPKSVDRLDFTLDGVAGLSAADGAATLVEVTAAAVARAVRHLPALPRRWFVTGGGRRNPAMMDRLSARLGAPCDPVEALGWQGDALEAQAFAFLAMRSRRSLPLSLPTTTGLSVADDRRPAAFALSRASVYRIGRTSTSSGSACHARSAVWTGRREAPASHPSKQP